MSVISSILVSLASLASTKLFGAAITAIILLIEGKIALDIVKKAVQKSKLDAMLQKFLLSAARVLIYFIIAIVVASALGFEMSSLVALASVVSAAFALAASGMLSNLFGGILLLITKPFGVGDYIIAGGIEGSVLEVGLLNTKVNTLDNKRITMPNSTISSTVITNCSTEGKRRVDLDFKVGYANDVETVKAAIYATAQKHPLTVDKDNIFVRVSAYEECVVAYTLRVWTTNEHYWDVYFDMLEQVKESFNQAGISMVYPFVNVRMEK